MVTNPTPPAPSDAPYRLRAEAWTPDAGWRTIRVWLTPGQTARLATLSRPQLERDPEALALLAREMGGEVIDLRNIQLLPPG